MHCQKLRKNIWRKNIRYDFAATAVQCQLQKKGFCAMHPQKKQLRETGDVACMGTLGGRESQRHGP